MRTTVQGEHAIPASDDADLARRLAAFSEPAWEELFERDYVRIYRFAVSRTGDRSAAEDIAAEVFEEAARRIGSYQSRGLPVTAWLLAIARNLVADHFSRRARRPSTSLDEATGGGKTSLDSVEDLVDVSRALQKLTPEQQDVIALRFVAGCDLAQTARAMNKNVGAVKVLQHRALQTLRRNLGPRQGPELR